MKFRPLHDRVVVKRIDAEEKTSGGIIIPDTAKEKPSQGEVIAVGPGGSDESGKLIPIDVRVGKNFRYRGTRVRALLDVANLFNSNAVLVLNTTYGGNWQRPTYVLPGRLIKPTVQIDF